MSLGPLALLPVRCPDPHRADLSSTLASHCRGLCDCPRPRPREWRRFRVVDLAAVVGQTPLPCRLGNGCEGPLQSDNNVEFDFDWY